MRCHARQMLHSILTPKRNNPARVTRAGTPGFQAVSLVCFILRPPAGRGAPLALLLFLLSYALEGKKVEEEAHDDNRHHEHRPCTHNCVHLDAYSYGIRHSCRPCGGDATPPRPIKDLPHGVHDKPRKGQGEDEQENDKSGKHYRLLSCCMRCQPLAPQAFKCLT